MVMSESAPLSRHTLPSREIRERCNQDARCNLGGSLRQFIEQRFRLFRFGGIEPRVVQTWSRAREITEKCRIARAATPIGDQSEFFNTLVQDRTFDREKAANFWTNHACSRFRCYSSKMAFKFSHTNQSCCYLSDQMEQQ